MLQFACSSMSGLTAANVMATRLLQHCGLSELTSLTARVTLLQFTPSILSDLRRATLGIILSPPNSPNSWI